MGCPPFCRALIGIRKSGINIPWTIYRTREVIMKAHALAPNLQLELFEIATEMNKKGLPADFIAAAVETATEFEGVYDLMKLWINESDVKEHDEIVADIQDMIQDCEQQDQKEAPYIRFNDLEALGKNIRAFKDSLLHTVSESAGLKRSEERRVGKECRSRWSP